MDKDVKRWKARAIMGGKDPTQLVIARKIGESIFVTLNGALLEITVASIGGNSVALLLETAEKNLILRKELVDAC